MTVIESPQAKATTSNPKNLFGARKVSLSKLPAVAVAHGAHAMMDGARKYGAYNWRDKKVIASIYVDAARRHIDNWFEGQRIASDSGVHHLGHAIACMGILLGAEAIGNLVDDRPAGSEIADKVYAEIASTIAARKPPVEHDCGLPPMQEQCVPKSRFGFTIGEEVVIITEPKRVGTVIGFRARDKKDFIQVRCDKWPDAGWYPSSLRHIAR